MATVNIHPDSTGTNNWTIYPSGTAHEAVDEGTIVGGHTPNDADYVYTQTATTGAMTLGFGDTPSDANLITSVAVNIRAKLDDGNGTGRIECKLYHSGTTQVGSTLYVTGGDLGTYGVIGECTKTWSGLTLTKTQADSLTIKCTLLAS
jgi:hypothetical protein